MTFLGNWRRWSALCGTAGLALLSATPAHAAVQACSPSGVHWTGDQAGNGQITLGPGRLPDGSLDMMGVWSSPVTLEVTCNDSGNPVPLDGAVFVIAGYSNSITDLRVTVDGSDPRLAGPVLPVPQYDPSGFFISNAPAVLATNLVSRDGGQVNFLMQAYSPSHPELSPTGAATPIGLHLELAVDTPTSTGGLDPIRVPGGGQLFAATPELDSVILLGTGLTGLAGYAALRLRARRRH